MGLVKSNLSGSDGSRTLQITGSILHQRPLEGRRKCSFRNGELEAREMALQWMLLTYAAAAEAAAALLLTLPSPKLLKYRPVSVVSLILQPAFFIVPFAGFQLLDEPFFRISDHLSLYVWLLGEVVPGWLSSDYIRIRDFWFRISFCMHISNGRMNIAWRAPRRSAPPVREICEWIAIMCSEL